jgi:SAM-dependent methyltransferase
MLDHVREVVQVAENSAKSREQAFQLMRTLGLDDFGQVLWSMPNPAFPVLSNLLPSMASVEDQRLWTGYDGYRLLGDTASFVRSVAYSFTTQTGRSLTNARMLDYGFGYGRVARLMYKFSPEDRVIGVDPWHRSIEASEKARLRNVFLSDYLPRSLPVQGKFDLIYAFSVFTHLSKMATLLALSTLRDYVLPEGVLCITIRPAEYWSQHPEVEARQKEEHRSSGFAFIPHNLPPIEGEVQYGDTSITTKWLLENCPEWRLEAEDRCLSDGMQRYIFLRPA